MSAKSLIEWTEATWNPLLGCDKCSAGCQHCYAIRTAWRMQHNPHPAVAKAYAELVTKRADGSLNWTGRINLIPERLREPMRWARPRRIFVNSQSDLFHDDVPDAFIDQVFAVMAYCRRHTFQVLTKRPARMRAYVANLERVAAFCGRNESKPLVRNATELLGVIAAENMDPPLPPMPHSQWPLPNVQLGTSVENQKAGYHLLGKKAAGRLLDGLEWNEMPEGFQP